MLASVSANFSLQGIAAVIFAAAAFVTAWGNRKTAKDTNAVAKETKHLVNAHSTAQESYISEQSAEIVASGGTVPPRPVDPVDTESPA